MSNNYEETFKTGFFVSGDSVKSKIQINDNLTTSTEFFRKSNQNFNPLSKAEFYSTLIQILRSDIIELHNIISKHSDILMLYKVNSSKYI